MAATNCACASERERGKLFRFMLRPHDYSCSFYPPRMAPAPQFRRTVRRLLFLPFKTSLNFSQSSSSRKLYTHQLIS
ncbi:hypothetical protein JTE90_016764 [Oedothorax gibbosus]|uniref:Uncharacterized protein n=1 Tax=Oedothorax gibbosus TaxID=931172 RepID=A0AAV6VXV2_9ARAC|nr:hypothetical protein JTE90_016764 [Oedothorax gibbosus]